MIYNLKIKKLGNFYEVLAIRAKEGNFTNSKINIKSQKSENNLIRAKNTIQDIALSNNFKYFFTLTYNTKYDRYNFFEIYKHFKKVIRFINESLDIKLSYLVVPEQHKDGAWHLHGFFDEKVEQIFFVNKNGYLSLKYFDSLGYQNIQPIKDLRRASSYVTKYISKNLGKGVQVKKHSFWASKGLSRGEEIFSKVYNNEIFNNHFFDYRNDYCCKRILTSEEFQHYRMAISLL